MSTVKKLAEEIGRGIKDCLPTLNKPVVRKLSLLVGTMIEGQTPNTAELAKETERQDMREQWIRRLLAASTFCVKLLSRRLPKKR